MLSKKLIVVAIVALAMGLIVKSSSVAGGEFPIISYGCANDWDGGGYREYFPQVDSCGFNIVYQCDFNQDDFGVANAMGLKLVRLLMKDDSWPNPCPWLIGQKSWYGGVKR